MKKIFPIVVILGLIASSLGVFAAEAEKSSIEDYPIVSFAIEGNSRIPTGQIMSKITHSKIGEPVKEDDVRADLQAIGDMGVFTDVSA